MIVTENKKEKKLATALTQAVVKRLYSGIFNQPRTHWGTDLYASFHDARCC
jgi:hypothetical protein